MPTVRSNGITVAYDESGAPSAPPLLLVAGLSAQLTVWPDPFVDALATGFRVIRFDNRDAGLSSWCDDSGEADILGVLVGTAAAPYSLENMAADAAGLLDALGVVSAHVVGVSMGGMIAQLLAIDWPHKVRSMVSIMSTTGDPSVGRPHAEAVAALLVPPARGRDATIEQGVAIGRVLGSPGFGFDEAARREMLAAAFDRADHPVGSGRQLAAIVAARDRTPRLRRLDCPTLVIHGDADSLIDVSGGRATAAAVPGARLEIVAGMGHELPDALLGTLAAAVAAHAHPHDDRLPAGTGVSAGAAGGAGTSGESTPAGTATESTPAGAPGE